MHGEESVSEPTYPESHDALEVAPEKLLRGFTATRSAGWIGVALVIHIVVIGLMSVGYVRDRWIDPEGAALRKAAAAAAKAEAVRASQAASAAQPSVAPAPQAGATGAVRSAVSAPAASNATERSEAALLQARTNTPVGRAVTEAAKPGEIPRQPDDLGLSLQDTQVK
jgi:hypothetical protein